MKLEDYSELNDTQLCLAPCPTDNQRKYLLHAIQLYSVVLDVHGSKFPCLLVPLFIAEQTPASSSLCKDMRTLYSSPPLSTGDIFQDPQWIPKTTDHTEPYMCYVFFSCIHTLTIKYSLLIKHSKKLTEITNNRMIMAI